MGEREEWRRLRVVVVGRMSERDETKREVVAELDVFFTDVDSLVETTQADEEQRQRQPSTGDDASSGGGGGGETSSSAAGASGSAENKKEWRQIVMLQCPLRPHSRPYPTVDASSVRVKPQNQRIEVDIPLKKQSENYEDRGRAKGAQVESLTLRSSKVDLHTKYMVGVVKDGRLILAPLSKAVQLRPKLSSLDPSLLQLGERGKQSGETMMESGLSGKPLGYGNNMELLTVKIQRHETPRQLAARHRSHAYLREQEESEPWSHLSVSSIQQDKSVAVRRRWADISDGLEPEKSGEESPNAGNAVKKRTLNYLRKLVPHFSDEQVGSLPSEVANTPLFQSMMAPLKHLLREVFEDMSVCSLNAIKSFSEDLGNDDLSRTIQMLSEESLHSAVVQTGDVVFMCGQYYRKYREEDYGNKADNMEAFRMIVLSMYHGEENRRKGFRKSNIQSTVLSKGISQEVFSQVYGIVMKDICKNNGGIWYLETCE